MFMAGVYKNLFNPSCLDKSENHLKFLFSHFFCDALKSLRKGDEGLHKTFWGTTEKCENKNLYINFYFNITFWNTWGRKG